MCELEVWYFSVYIRERFGNYSLGEVPSPPAMKILM